MDTDNLQIMSADGARGQCILRLVGSLTIRTVSSFQEIARAQHASALILDFSGVPYVDSAGFGALVGLYISSKNAQRRLAFTSMNTRVLALIEMNNVAQLFPTYASVPEAEAALA